MQEQKQESEWLRRFREEQFRRELGEHRKRQQRGLVIKEVRRQPR